MKNRLFVISMTVLWCIIFSNALHNRVVGICIGCAMGMAYGLFDSGREK